MWCCFGARQSRRQETSVTSENHNSSYFNPSSLLAVNRFKQGRERRSSMQISVAQEEYQAQSDPVMQLQLRQGLKQLNFVVSNREATPVINSFRYDSLLSPTRLPANQEKLNIDCN